MRAARTALAMLCACTAAGCGSAQHTATTATVATAQPTTTTAPAGLQVAVVGTLDVGAVPGASITPVAGLDAALSYPLVVVTAETPLEDVVAAAVATPTSHFAYVGGSTRGRHRPNLVGIVLDDAQAAQLGGVVAGLVAADQGGAAARVAWVGPAEPELTAAFSRGAQRVNPGVTVLRAATSELPAACKEAALGAIARGAVTVMAHQGLCADAAIAGAHQQNHVGLRISDFELPAGPVSTVIGDAVAGVYRGGEDIVFGASSGAIGIRALDPRISADVAVRARSAAQQLASGLRPSG